MKRLIKELSIFVAIILVYSGIDGFLVPYLLDFRNTICPVVGFLLLVASTVAIPVIFYAGFKYFKTTYSSGEKN